MRNRSIAVLGPAVVLYFVADLIARGAALQVGFAAGVLIALGMTLIPLVAGVRSGSFVLLCAASALSLLGALPEARHSDFLATMAALALGTIGASGFAAAVSPGLMGSGRLRLALQGGVWILGAVAATAGVLSHAPLLGAPNSPMLWPASWSAWPRIYATGALGVGAVIAFRTRDLRSEHRAATGWLTLGTATSSVLLFLSDPWLSATGPSALIVAAALLSLVLGHAVAQGGPRQVFVGPAIRSAISWVLAYGLIVAATFPLVRADPAPRFLVGWALGVALVGQVLRGLWRRPLGAFLSPFRGRLLEAVREIERDLPNADSLESLAGAVLPPLRRASADLESEPMLFVVSPAFELGVDASGHCRQRPSAMPDALRQRILECPGEVIVRAEVERAIVREPENRRLFDVLCDLDALCVLPLLQGGELEGAIVIPRGARRTPPSLEELALLRELARSVVSSVRVFANAARMATRFHGALKEIEDLEVQYEREQRLRGRLERIVGRDTLSHRGTFEPLVAHSPAMRSAMSQVERFAPTEGPLFLFGEGGVGVHAIARELHLRGGRSEGPLIVGHCGDFRGDALLAALLGAPDGGDGGWLEQAQGGTLVLHDVVALPADLQGHLAEAIATKRFVAGNGDVRPLEGRPVMTARVALADFQEQDLVHPALRQWFAAAIEVPPLRHRREDLESLVYLGLDRACRTAGRPVMGIDPEAMEKLTAHDWPGNLPELWRVVERAVDRARGPRVVVADLPPLIPAEHVDPFEGTYVELERRILLRALTRAGGNKSEAARALGLKRTTFLDKLERFGILEEGIPPSNDPPTPPSS
ncbi:MAG: sigma-54-dependent Fis family transcriptional regulator [Myxococcales bacterium]|nr:sigma-54-dependent Fis family transcriptional regulator [Myxococcales bacterium]